MRILHVAPGLDATQGGIRTAVVGAMRAMAAVGMHAEAACVSEPDPPLPGLHVHAFAASWPRLTRASRDLRAWLRHHLLGFDAVAVHTLWLSPVRYALDAALSAGVPALLAPHGMLDPDALAHHAWRKRLRWLTGERDRVRGAVLVFSTPEDASRALATGLTGSAPHAVIPNPVDRAWFNLRRVPHDGPPRVLCLNRWHPRKGVLELVRALNHLHKRDVAFSADLAGNPEDSRHAAAVRAAAEPLLLAGKLRLHGLVDASGARALVAGADILVHPATGFENFGMVTAEAAAAGLCVVGSPRALLTPQMAQAGVVVASEPEPQALADALAPLLADHDRREELGGRARQWARSHLGLEHVGGMWEAALHR